MLLYQKNIAENPCRKALKISIIDETGLLFLCTTFGTCLLKGNSSSFMNFTEVWLIMVLKSTTVNGLQGFDLTMLL